jgi:hypothetical protein
MRVLTLDLETVAELVAAGDLDLAREEVKFILSPEYFGDPDSGEAEVPESALRGLLVDIALGSVERIERRIRKALRNVVPDEKGRP